MKKIAVIILAIALLAGAGYYFWQNRNKYFFQGEESYAIMDDEVDAEAEKVLHEEGELKDDSGKVSDGEEIDDDESKNDYKSPVIFKEDCDNSCEDYDNQEDRAYCLEYCGFTEDDPDRKSEGCEELDKLERDACFKQQAVDEQDMRICKKISDAQLQENCENRVLEELLK